MKNQTIITGPIASGKTWISRAIINQHSQNDVIQLTRIDNTTLAGLLLQTKIKLLVVDQCNEEDILKCLEVIGSKNLRILFITQDKINNKDFPNSHIINLHKSDQYKIIEAKAKRWDELEDKISECYDHTDEEGNDKITTYESKYNIEPDLTDVGEIAASAFGWLDY